MSNEYTIVVTISETAEGLRIEARGKTGNGSCIASAAAKFMNIGIKERANRLHDQLEALISSDSSKTIH